MQFPPIILTYSFTHHFFLFPFTTVLICNSFRSRLKACLWNLQHRRSTWSTVLLPLDCRHVTSWTVSSAGYEVPGLFFVDPFFRFCAVSCARLRWHLVNFWAHVQTYTVSYRKTIVGLIRFFSKFYIVCDGNHSHWSTSYRGLQFSEHCDGN